MSNDYRNRFDRGEWWWVAAVCLVVYAVFYQVLSFDFLDWDDNLYVLENPIVQSWSFDGLKEAFTTPQILGSYNPVVLLSWMIDYSIWGMNPLGFHLSNLILHLINSILVYVLIALWTRSSWVAVVTAVLFGIHPMHVEPVAWVSGRKDLVMALFSVLSLIGYQTFLKTRSKTIYILSVLAFTLAVLSKAVAVVLPVVFILVDWCIHKKEVSLKLLFDKWLLLAISLIVGFVAMQGQSEAKAFFAIDESILTRPIFVLGNLFDYTIGVFYVSKLSAFHPFLQVDLQTWFKTIAVLVMLSVFIIVGRKNRLVLFALSFYLLWLLPTLQLIPFGMSALGERFTYVSYIGAFMLLAYGLEALILQIPAVKKITIAIVAIWIGGLGFKSYAYASSWKNTTTLWNQVYQSYPNHYFSSFKLGTLAIRSGDSNKAFDYFDKSILLNPKFAQGYTNRGMLLMQSGQLQSALSDFDKALSLEPKNAVALTNKGAVLIGLGEYQAAESIFTQALQQPDVDSTIASYNLGRVFESTGNRLKALTKYSYAFRSNETNLEYRYRYAKILALQSRIDEAERIVTDGLAKSPNQAELLMLLSEIQATKSEFSTALTTIQLAIEAGANVDSTYIELLRSKAKDGLK